MIFVLNAHKTNVSNNIQNLSSIMSVLSNLPVVLISLPAIFEKQTTIFIRYQWGSHSTFVLLTVWILDSRSSFTFITSYTKWQLEAYYNVTFMCDTTKRSSKIKETYKENIYNACRSWSLFCRTIYLLLRKWGKIWK